jgi:hypothetical protein
MILDILICLIIASLLGVLGKAFQKMIIKGFERAGIINSDREYIEARKRLHEKANI